MQKMKNFRSKNCGFTIVEMLAATGIAAIVITSALGVVSSIYFSQKRVQFSQDFYAETRYLMERIAQIARNNTLDYDRFFVEVGPPTSTCTAFQVGNYGQVPTGYTDSRNESANRAVLKYPTIFYWDTNNDTNPDRNLGGVKGGATATGLVVDPCAQAWDNSSLVNASQSTLYLINSARTVRTAIKFNQTNNTVELQTQIGADTDKDGIADVWGPDQKGTPGPDDDINLIDWTASSGCQISYRVNSVWTNFPVFGDAMDEDFCDQAHDFTAISPMAITVNNLYFLPSPNRDPFLAFRVDEAQVHPSVFIGLDVELRNPNKYGFEISDVPQLNFQTTVSSRVFGNIRE